MTMLSSYYSQKFLKLSGVLIKDIYDDNGTTIIEIETERKPLSCPCCNHVTDAIHDYRLQPIKDIPAFGNHTILLLRKRRYVCKDCGKRFYENLDFLPRYYRHTKRLAFYILQQLSSTHSFKSVSAAVNLSITTVIRIFDNLSYAPESLPKVLGIDEFKGNTGHEKYQCIITDPENRTIIDILPNRYKADLTSYFLKFDTSKTSLFISDMWGTYRDLAKELFNNATYVVDKYHYARQVLWAFESIRKDVQKDFSDHRRKYFKRSRTVLIKHFKDLTDDQKRQVNFMLYTSDKLANAYILKETFYDFMESEDYEIAKERLQSWILFAEDSQLQRFVAVAKTMTNWQKGILNSFATPYTNGYTEGMNNKIKVLKRNAYGYRNFNRFRNRILHMCNTKSS
jgi:transposase